MARSEARMILNKLFEIPTEPYPKHWTTRMKLPAIPVGTQSCLEICVGTAERLQGDRWSADDFRWEVIHWKVQRRGWDDARRCQTAQTRVPPWQWASHLLSSPLQVFGWPQPHKEPAASCHPCPEASPRSIPRKQKHTLLFWFVLPVIILCLSKPTKSVSWIEKSILNQKGSTDTAEIFKGYGGKRSSSSPFAHKGY